jgi:tagatose 6-phosphate kinase
LITTVTLNAAVDKQYMMDALIPGNGMGVKGCSGSVEGNGMNVSRVANIIGEKSLAIGFVGGDSGDFLEEQLCRQGIEHDFVHLAEEGHSSADGIDDATGGISGPFASGAAVKQEDFERLKQKLSANIGQTTVVVLSGGAPEGCSSFVYNELIHMAKEKGKKVILDTCGDLLAKGIQVMPTMIVINTEQVKALTGTVANDTQGIIKAAQVLHREGIEYFVVSLGKGGALVICDQGVFEGTPPEVEMVNTEGCVDSMVATFAVGFARGYTIEQSLKYALAVSSAVAMTTETAFLRISDLFQIMDSAVVKKI